MRADRLLALLMLLQTRSPIPAADLARELEVSERTIYRDMEALSAAGVPVYTSRGPGGGCCLVADYRTTLTGLTAAEIRALFMLNVPGPLDELGVSHELKGALRKLSAALPAAQALDDGQSRQRFYLDSSWWPPVEGATQLDVLRQAVWSDSWLQLRFRSFISGEIELMVAPLGLVSKAGIWYLVYQFQDQVRSLKVERIVQAEILPGTFTRPAGFDLGTFWRDWCQDMEQENRRYTVVLRAAPGIRPRLLQHLGGQARQAFADADPPDEAGWMQLVLGFDSLVSARDRLLSYGSAVEVLAPAALRLSLQDFARQILTVYAEP
ncbi:MAG TPA: WYL domain-containing protein [Anaerolineaceae bacterium]|nr:WYL domain-containing protein [Anaerolineaceae bacterium]